MKRRAQPWLGTLVDITIADTLDSGQLATGFNAAFARIGEVHRLMSFHDPHSDVSRINRAAVGTPVVVNAHTARVIAAALVLTEASGSIFNPGCATRLVQWGLLPHLGGALPDYDATDSGLAISDQCTVVKTRALLIDLGGIAKGYAVDQAIDALENVGINSACVNAGGDLRVLGSAPFSVAIRDPQAVTSAGARIDLADAAMATSAGYFSSRQIDDRTVSALIDGRSGAAVNRSTSASVIASECLLADALTKIVMATGEADHPILARFGARAFIL